MALFSKNDNGSRSATDVTSAANTGTGAGAAAKGTAAKGANAKGADTGKKTFSELMKTEINLTKPAGDVLPGGGSLPTKTTMNLYQTTNEDTKKRSRILLICVVAAVIIVAALAFMFLRIAALKTQVASLESELATYESQLVDYDAVNEEYTRYSDGYLSRDQSALVDRMTVESMVDSAVSNLGEITSLSIRENTATVTVTTSSLDDVSSIRRNIEASSIVYKVSVETAKYNTSSSNSSSVVSTITIMVSQDGKAPKSSKSSSNK